MSSSENISTSTPTWVTLCGSIAPFAAMVVFLAVRMGAPKNPSTSSNRDIFVAAKGEGKRQEVNEQELEFLLTKAFFFMPFPFLPPFWRNHRSGSLFRQ